MYVRSFVTGRKISSAESILSVGLGDRFCVKIALSIQKGKLHL